MSPRFLVVIPLFNKEKHIARAVNSVLSQSFVNFKLVIVDDGSTDSGLDVARQFEKDARVAVIQQTNQGVSAARNAGANSSSDEYICFLDGDDEWYDNFLEVMADLLGKHPGASLYTVSHDTITEDGEMISPYVALPIGFSGPVESFASVYSAGYGVINSSSVCVSRHFFNSIGGFPVGKGNGEDMYFWLRAGMEGTVVCSSLRCCVNYRDALNRSSDRSVKLPYHFEYFYPMLREMADGQSKRSLIKFLRKNAILQISGAVLNQQRYNAINIFKFVSRYDVIASCVAIVAIIMPQFVLRAMKYLRANVIRI